MKYTEMHRSTRMLPLCSELWNNRVQLTSFIALKSDNDKKGLGSDVGARGSKCFIYL